jgi:hypothetical protein
LQVQKRCQIAVVDAHIALRGDGGLCVQRDTDPGALQHAQIVRAVADGQHIRVCRGQAGR